MKNSILGKARWLREVALATSKNNGARVAREWLKYAAMFVMLFTIGIGNAWGETVTYKQTSTSEASVSSGTAPKGSNVTFSNSYITKEQLTSGKNMVLTLTSLGEINISNITLSMKSNKSGGAGKLSYSTDGGKNWTYLVGSSSQGTAFNNSAWNGSYTTSYKDVSKDVSLSNVTQLKIRIEATANSLYCQSFTITYTASVTSHTLSSAVSPAESGSVELSATSVAEGSKATATATPAAHYVFDHWSISGTGSTLSSTTTNPTTVTMGTADATVTATFTKAPKASITLSEAGATTTDATTYYVGDSYTLPSSTGASCGTKVLVGWSTVTVSETDIKPASNFYEKGETVTLEATQTFYAVFATASGGGSSDMKIDFEGESSTYSDWTFKNLNSQQTGTITAHGGTYYGTTGGVTTASVTTINKIASPTSLTAYVSKQTNNTTSSTWYIRVSSDGSTWTDVKSQSATSMSKGSWVEMTADLTDYSDVYVQVYYDGSTAVRNIDDLTLTIGGGTTYSAYSTTCQACVAPTSVTITGTNKYLGGQTISLTATPEGGTGTPSYQWQKKISGVWTNLENGNGISGATDAILQISSCTHANSGGYRCIVSTGDGCETKSHADDTNGYGVHVFSLTGGYSGGDWSAHDITWTSGTTGTATIHLNASSTYMFKVFSNNGYYYGNGENNYIIQPVSWDCGINNHDMRLFTGPEGDYTFTVNIEHGLDGFPYVNVQVGYPAVSHPSTGYIYISKWWDCYVHYWEGTNNALMPWGSDPKIDADRYATICGNDYWYFPVIATYNKFIAKDKAGDPKNTTGDQVTTNHGGMYITHNGSNWVWGNFATYTIAYAGGDGSTGGPMASHTGLCSGSSQQLTANAFSKAYHTFNGWSDGNGHTYADQAMIENIQSNINLTAQWTPEQYNITATLTNVTSTTSFPVVYTYTGSAAGVTYTFAAADGFRLPDAVTVTGSTYTWDQATGQLTLTGTISGAVSITISGAQTHTVTWKVSGSADNEVVYDHGDALVLPSNPSAPTACSEKRFVGWKEGAIDGSTDDRPTMLNPSSPGTVTADKTYYAVFADEGTTFTKVTDPSVFVAGDKIAIVSNDNSYGLRISSNAPAATAITISDAATITPAADQVFTLAGNSTDGFTMSTASRTSEGTVTLGAASVLNSNSSADVILSSSNNTWKFSAHNTSNCILISPSSKSTCGLEYYKSSWKIYNNSGVASNAACAMRVYRKNLSGYVTTCSECMTPSDLEVSAITSTGATVTWAGVSQTQQAGGSGTGYKVAWNTSNSVPSPLNASNSADVAAGTNTYDITGLTAATQYYVFVQSKCDDSWSSSTNFYTNAKITYAAGEGSGSMDPKEVTYNTDATVDACTFTAPSGKKFNGWVSDQSVMVSASSTTSVPEGATVTGLTKAITLTAQWRDLASYTVNFSADNGTVAGGTAQTVYEEGKLTFPNVTSTTCGTFIGWVEAAYDNTAAPSGATFHAAGSQIDVVAELEGKTYYAVYRVATGMATTLTDNLVPSDFKATGTSYEATNNLVKTSSATYEAVTAKGNNAIQINKISDGRGIVSKISGGIFKGITLTTNANHSASRKVYVYGSRSYTAAYADPAAFKDNSSVRGTLLATLEGATKTYSTSTDDYEYIAIFADGAAYMDQIDITWYGAPMKYQTSPTCSPMVGVESNFSTFTYAYNAGPSASQSFTVSGSSLGADLVVTAPANYEVCKTADGTYTSTISYTPSDGAVANTTAYIRLAAGLNVGTYNYAAASGLQVTSTGAKTRTAALNGSVTKADCAITFTDFNAVDHYEATLEYGSRVTVSYNYTYNGDGNFSISRSPATGTIDKANKTLTVSTAGIWTLNASATAGTNYSKPSDASAQIRVKCVDTYKDFIHNKTIKAYGSGTAVTDGKMEDWGSGYTVPYIDDNAEETSGSCQQTHYKFMGWVSEDDINIADGTFKTGWTLIQAGTESKLATTKTYYAVWAKLEE